MQIHLKQIPAQLQGKSDIASSADGDSPSLNDVRALLERDGRHAVLLPIESGQKGPRWKDWSTVKYEQTLRASYQAQLSKWANTGILLGAPSNDLCAFDWDTEAGLNTFLALNPAFKNTLCTRGERGGQLWAYITGPRPRKVHTLLVSQESSLAEGCKESSDKDGLVSIGEFRAEGGQSVIRGIHPCGRSYTWVVHAPPITVSFDEIQWPADVRIPWEVAASEPKRMTQTYGEKEAETEQIKQLALEHLEELCQYLLPAGKRVGTRWHVGSINGDPGKSFDVNLRTGQFGDWANSEKMRIGGIQLWMEVRHVDFSAAKSQLAHWLSMPFRLTNSTDLTDRKTQVDLKGLNNDCPYPAIDWSAAKQVGRSLGFHHRAIYPRDSILHPFMEISRLICEGADCYLLGSVLPVAAAMLERRVWTPWAEQTRLYTNLYSMLVGKPGDRKTSAINIPERIALECLPADAFLPYCFSPESLFDAYYRRPDRILIIDDANPILNDWKLSSNGARTAAQFLRFHDCKRLAESYLRNKSETTSADRIVPETSTSVLFGATFNVAAFQGQQVKEGLARRFLYYIADKHGRKIVNPPTVNLHELSDLFKQLLGFSGEVCFDSEATAVWEAFNDDNRDRYATTTFSQDALAGRISSEPTHVAKIAIIFEACRCIHYGTELKAITKVSLEKAIEHVTENLRSAAFLDTIANRAVTAERAEIVIAAIRRKFRVMRPSTIYASKSELTYEICHQGSRQGSIKSEELYAQVIPQLEAQGLARLAFKRGKLEVFAFQTEDFQDDSDLISANSSNSSPGYMD